MVGLTSGAYAIKLFSSLTKHFSVFQYLACMFVADRKNFLLIKLPILTEKIKET